MARFRAFSSLPVPISGWKPLELVRTEVLVKQHKIALFQPKDVDDVLEMYISQGKLGGDPYWCRLWPSSIGLAEEVLSRPSHVSDLRVCDIGAGLGLGSIAAAFAGAKEVVLLDQEPLALLCALLSLQENFPGICTNMDSFLLQYFPQFTVRNISASPSTLRATAERFDWTEVYNPHTCFDTVIGCDLLYEKSAPGYLSSLAPKLLSQRKRGRFLLTDPVERTPKHRDLFVELMQAGRFNVSMHSRRRVEMDAKLHDLELICFEY